MSTYSRAIKAVAVNVATVVLFCLWQFLDQDWAGNLLCFWLVIVGLLGCVAFFITASGKIPPRMKFIERMATIVGVAMVLAMAAVGSFGVAVVYLLGMIGLSAYRQQFDDEGQLIKKGGRDAAKVNG